MLKEELFKKEEGRIQSASADRHWLEKSRAVAEGIGKRTGFCSIEDVRLAWQDSPFPTGNWCGSVFKDRNKWVFDHYFKAFHDESHARIVTLWKYKEAKNG